MKTTQSRRDFLKALGALVVAGAVSVPVAKEIVQTTKYDPDAEAWYRRWIELGADINEHHLMAASDLTTRMKQNGIWDKLTEMYVPVPGFNGLAQFK